MLHADNDYNIIRIKYLESLDRIVESLNLECVGLSLSYSFTKSAPLVPFFPELWKLGNLALGPAVSRLSRSQLPSETGKAVTTEL